MIGPRVRGRVRQFMSAPAAVLVVAALAGCTGDGETDPDPGPARPASSYVERSCPEDVAAALVEEARCGTLTVPERRGAGESDRTVELLVVELVPAELRSDDPVVVVGAETAHNYAGIAPLAQRTGRRVLILDPRGVGHSTPSLACPPAAESVGWTDRTGSDGWRAALAARADRCHQQLVDDGVDVAAYDVQAMAADLRDLLAARATGPVNLISYGTGSRVVLEALRTFPDRLRSVVLDSPELAGADPRAVGPATAAAFEQVLAWCGQDARCARQHPDADRLLDRALAALAERPLRLQVPTSFDAGAPRAEVLLDAGLLVRLARQTLTDGGSAGPWGQPLSLPGLLAAASDRDRGTLREAAFELLGLQGPLCPGYRPKCMPAHVVAEGVASTLLCRDTVLGEQPSGSGPGFREAFDRAWWWDVCDHWPVPPDPEVAEPVTTDVPALVLEPGLAPPTPEDELRRLLAGLTAASVVVVPTQAHNVLGGECLTALRNAWLDDPRPVTKPACVPTRLEW